MINRLISLALLVSGSLISARSSSSDILRKSPTDPSDTILIVLNETQSFSRQRYNSDDFAEIGKPKVEDLTDCLFEEGSSFVPKKGALLNKSRFRRILRLTNTRKEKFEESDLTKLRKREDIQFASLDRGVFSFDMTPNDSHYSQQWAPPHIGLDDAWSLNSGSPSIKIGVIDSGIDANHPDLSSRIDSALSQCFSDYHTNPLEDTDGHGTRVAGIIGAAGNNNLGIAGVCWGATLVSLRVVNYEGKITPSRIVNAITYATSCGIPILNMSAGMYGPNGETVNVVRQAIQNYDGLFVCSAGNKGYNTDSGSDATWHFASNYEMDNVLAVGNSTSQDERYVTSNYGAISVDVFAPGTNIYTTIPCSDSPYPDNDYAYCTGTSAAAPQVAGLAALLLSQDPTLTALELKSIILETATPIPALSGYCVTGARINAYDALWSVYHNHSYDDHYAWVNDMSHLAYCACGESVSQGHIVSGGLQPFAFGYSTCLLCGGRARMGFVN